MRRLTNVLSIRTGETQRVHRTVYVDGRLPIQV